MNRALARTWTDAAVVSFGGEVIPGLHAVGIASRAWREELATGWALSLARPTSIGHLLGPGIAGPSSQRAA